MKLIIKIVLGVALAGTCLFGFTNAGQHALSFIAGLRRNVEEALPTRHHMDVARRQLADIEQQILNAEGELDSHAREEKRLGQDIRKLRSLQDSARTRLTALRPALAGGEEYVQCGACRYHQNDVASDAAALAAFITRSDEAIASRESALQNCRTVMEETRNSLTETRSEFAGAKSRVEELSLTLKQEEAIAAVKDATDAARGAVSDETRGDLARTVALLENRAAALKRKNATRGTAALPASRVPLPETTGAALLETVDAALGKNKAVASE